MNARPLRWDDLEIFLATARGGSLAAAANSLGVNASTIQRRIGRLEKGLRTRLFDRTQRGYGLTPTGEALLEHVLTMEETALSIDRVVAGRDQALDGPIHLSTVDDLTNTMISPMLHRFMGKHPAVKLQLSIGNRLADLGRRQADIAIRFGPKPTDDDVIVRKLASVDAAVYGAKSYFKQHKPPRRLSDLKKHRIVAGHHGMRRQPMEQTIVQWVPEDRVVARTDSIQVRRSLIRDGIGIGFLACYMAERERGLQRTSISLQDTTGLWILIHLDLRRNARVRALVDFLTEQFRGQEGRFAYPND